MPRLTPVAALVAGAATLLSHSAAAQQTMHPVVITANRVEQRVQDTLADVTVVDREQIETAAQSTLTELLARQPGIQMTSQGGPGASTDFFIRGADTRQSVVLIDGVRVGSGSTGTAALQYLPLSQIERIEVLRGPASAVYGADAIGGVIQIFTRRGEPGLDFDLFTGAGSYGTSDSRVGLRGGNGVIDFSLAGSLYHTRGFSTTNPDINLGVSPSRRNYNPDRDAHLNRSVSGSVGITPQAGTRLTVSLLDSEGYNEYDSGLAFVNTRNVFNNSVLTAAAEHAWTDWLTTTLRFGRSIEDFTSYARTSPRGNDFRTEQTTQALEARVKLPLGTLFGSIERLEQDVLSVTPTVVNIDQTRRVDSGQLGWTAQIDRHLLQANTRHDRYTGGVGKATGNVAYGYRLTEELTARAAYGTGYRLPTFNQLYFPNFGNPDLKPESSTNREIGLAWQRKSTRLAVTAYDNRVQNLINSRAPLVNVAEARLKGATFEAATYVFGHTELQGSVDILSARDEDTGLRLQRRAAQTATVTVQQHMLAGRVGVEVQAVGDRWSEPGELRRMGGYALLNLFGVWKASPEVSVEARVNNLNDRRYTSVFGYETSGANAFVGVRYTPRF